MGGLGLFFNKITSVEINSARIASVVKQGLCRLLIMRFVWHMYKMQLLFENMLKLISGPATTYDCNNYEITWALSCPLLYLKCFKQFKFLKICKFLHQNSIN